MKKAKQKRYRKGHWLGIGMAIGIPIGMVMFLAMGIEYMSIGIAVGAGLGVSIGSALEARYNPKSRALTMKEIKLRKWAAGLGFITFLTGLTVFLIMLLG